MYFLIRNNKYIELTGNTFRDLMDGKIKKMDATFSDWENHITTIFTEVRLKKIIEVRGADGGVWSRVCALPAFWTGILYDRSADEIWLIIKSWKFNEIKKFTKMSELMVLKQVLPIMRVFSSSQKKL